MTKLFLAAVANPVTRTLAVKDISSMRSRAKAASFMVPLKNTAGFRGTPMLGGLALSASF